ncbi:hypothetical protein HQ585_14010 [candidate division KSB1 bacterium]|nr:hypothetical protein [candidate division KSB1 bacterium]
MKKLNDIERLLKESKLPDWDLSQSRHEMWHQILKKRRDRRRLGFLFRIRPWIWALMSIILIVLCFMFMLWVTQTN